MAKHKSKLRGFDFNVIYESGAKNPIDYASHHPPPLRQYTKSERERLGVEEEEEDTEIIVNRIEALVDAVTLPVLQHYTAKDNLMTMLREDIQKGRLRPELAGRGGFKEHFTELSWNNGVILRGDRLLIPTELRPDILAVSHEGHPGMDAMLRQLRQDVWWRGMDKDIQEYVGTCSCVAAGPRNTMAPMTVR